MGQGSWAKITADLTNASTCAGTIASINDLDLFAIGSRNHTCTFKISIWKGPSEEYFRAARGI